MKEKKKQTEKKGTQKIEKMRKFVFVHKDGQEEIMALDRASADARFTEKGFTRKDIADVYEVRI